MSQKRKQQAVLKLFTGFPNMLSLSEEQLAAIVAVYLEVLQEISSRTVFLACEQLGNRPSDFAPSRGTLRAECLKVDEHERRERAAKQAPMPRYVVPIDRMSDDEKAASRARVNELARNWMRDPAQSRCEVPG